MKLYAFNKYAFEDIRTGGLSTPISSEADSATGTSVTYCVLPASYTIDGNAVKTIPSGSIIQFAFTAGDDTANSKKDNKIEIKYVADLGANTLVDHDLGDKINDVKASAYALLAEDYTIGDRKIVYYIVENTSNVEVR